jgi:hypothetical protein
MRKSLVFFTMFFNYFLFSQDIKYNIINASINLKSQIFIEIEIINNTNTNYVFNNFFTLLNNIPEFSINSYTKINFFKNDSIINVANVRFENKKDKELNFKRNEVFFVKANSIENFSFVLQDYLSETEKIGLMFKLIKKENLEISFNFYQSDSINIKSKKIVQKIRNENYFIYNGEIIVNKVPIKILE